MSWRGPASAAPYQTQYHASGSNPYYQQQSYEHGQHPHHGQHHPLSLNFPPVNAPQRPPDNRPPKKKGNPVITRYPPPPGYRGPVQSHGSFNTPPYPTRTTFAHQPPPFPPQAAPGFPTYPPPHRPTPMSPGSLPHNSNYSQPPHVQAPEYQWAQQGPPPNHAHQQLYHHTHMLGHAPAASSFGGYYSQPNNIPTNGQQVPGHRHMNEHLHHPHPREFDTNRTTAHSNSFVANAKASAVHITAPHAASKPPLDIRQLDRSKEEAEPSEKPKLYLAWDDWDFDFENVIWPKSNEHVDPTLSLGVIIWHPAKQVTRALPSTFEEAEEQAIAPIPEKLGNGESVSVYFTTDNSHEAFLDVRQTDQWNEIRGDPIFVVFSDQEMRQNIVSLEDCIALSNRLEDNDTHMSDATAWSVMDHLEEALIGVNDGAQTPQTQQTHRETASSGLSQEDILAKLGVTGHAKPVVDQTRQSEANIHTMVGSDLQSEISSTKFEQVENGNLSPNWRNNPLSKKRSYDDAENANTCPSSLEDDYNRRKRRSMIDAAYSRR